MGNYVSLPAAIGKSKSQVSTLKSNKIYGRK